MSFSLARGRYKTATSSLGVSREALFLLAICLLDAVSSAWLFHHNLAVEANPLLLPFAQAGTMPFLLAKGATFVPALVAAEWYGRRRPEFVVPLLRMASILYLAIYGMLVLRQF